MTDERFNAREQHWARKSKQERSADTASDAKPSDASKGVRSFAAPSRISLLYESKDGRFCLFEDGEGHLTAVRASLLA